MLISCLKSRARSLGCLVVAGALCATLGGCASRVKTSPTVHHATLSGQYTQETSWVTKGQTLTVQLPSVANSRSAWRVSPSSAKNEFVSLMQRQTQRDANGGLAETGEQAFDVFTFRAKRSGQVTLEFVFGDAYTNNTPSAQQFVLTVDVMQPGQGAAVASVSAE